MSKTFLRHTFTKNIFDIVVDSPLKPRILNPYLSTLSLYENPSFTIVSADRIYFDKISNTMQLSPKYTALEDPYLEIIVKEKVASVRMVNRRLNIQHLKTHI